MPKIIKDLRKQLLAEAKKQMQENGYSRVTVRSVASGCGIGVGTLYNYFPSKDMMIASFMLEDWNVVLSRIAADAKDGQVLPSLYTGLLHYIEEYKDLFADKDAAKVFRAVIAERHSLLREQIASLMLPVCQASSLPDPAFTADFLAEAFLTWSVTGRDYRDLSPIIDKILKK